MTVITEPAVGSRASHKGGANRGGLSPRRRSRRRLDRLATVAVTAAFLLALFPLVSLLITVGSKGFALLSAEFLTTDMVGVFGDMTSGGVWHAVVGTLMVTLTAAIIAVPLGILTAIYLVEYGQGRLAKAITFFVDVMTGIPSIVAGLFAFALFGMLFGVGTKNGLAGAIALSVLMIPTVVRNSEEMLRIVPNELREASLALGVPKWATIAKVVLPTAASGLASGVTLAIARVIGETAPLLVAVGFTRAVNADPTDGPMMNLALYAYYMFARPLNPGYRDPSIERAWASAVLLVLIVVILNLTARAIAKAFAPKTSGR